MIDMHSFRAGCVEVKQRVSIYPWRGAVLYVLSAIVQTRWVEWVIRPSISACFVDGIFLSGVPKFLTQRYKIAISDIGFVFGSPPVVLIFAVFSKILRSAIGHVQSRAWFAFVTYGIALLVIFTAGFFNTAAWADFEREWLLTGFHNRDIITQAGDVKQP